MDVDIEPALSSYLLSSRALLRPAPFFPSILSRSFLIVARTENPKPRNNSSIFDIFVTIASPIAHVSTTRSSNHII